MFKFFFILMVSLAFLLLGFAAYFYRGFSESRARRWKFRVLARHQSLWLALRRLQFDDAEEWDAETVEREFFAKYLHARNLDALVDFGGLGRGTVGLLHAASYRSIGQMEGAHLENVHGIGPAKAKLVRHAVGTIVRRMWGEFKRAECEQGSRYAELHRENREREARERAERKPKIEALSDALDESQKLVKVAMRITLIRFILDKCELFTDAMAERELLSVDDILNSVPKPVPVSRPLPTAHVQPSVTPAFAAKPNPSPSKTSPSVRVLAKPVQLPQRNRPSSPEPESKPVPAPPPLPEPALLPQMRSMASLGLLMARADGSIDPEERTEVRRFLGEQYGGLLPHLDSVIDAAERRGDSEMTVLMGLGTYCPTAVEKLRAYNFALRVADAAGGRHARELALLGRLRERLGLTDLPPLTEEPWPRARIVLPPPSVPKPVSSERFAPSNTVSIDPQKVPSLDLEPLRQWAELGILVARADGRISAPERFVVRQQLVEKFGRDLRLIPYIDPELDRAEKSRPMELVMMNGVKALCTNDGESREAYQFAERIVNASNGRSRAELELLARFAEVLEIPPAPSEPQLREFPTPEPNDSPPLSPPIALPDIEPLRTWVELGILVGRVDGELAASERLVIRQLLVEKFGSDSGLIPYIDPELDRAESRRHMESVVMKRAMALCPSAAERREAYRFAEFIADASNIRTHAANELLERFCEVLKLDEVHLQRITQSIPRIPAPNSVSQYDTIGVAVGRIELAGFRDNALLDDVFGSPVDTVPAVATGAGDLRNNDLLDDIFGA